MATAMNELTSMLMKLPDKQRAQLVANLMASLPSVLTDQDEGIGEALRRDAEIDDGSQPTISLDDLDAAINNRRC
jgi:putative addiction module component (TIGR02574 family)